MINFSTFKAFAGDNLNVASMAKFVFDRVDNIAEKAENACLFPTMFSKDLFLKGSVL